MVEMMKAIQNITFLASLTVLVGCSDPDPIRIGFIAGLEGRASGLGIASRNAVQMAVDEANANGGINGRQIELIIRDDKRSAKGGAEAARSLVSENVTAIIGPILSVVAGGVVPVINDAKIVTVSPTVISSKFVGKDDFFFRLNSSGEQSAADYARVYHEAGFSRIAAATDAHNKAFTENWMKLFTAAFGEYGGEVSPVVPFNAAKELSLKHVIVSLLDDKPEAVLILANGIDTAQLAQQFRKRDGDTQLLATSWAGSGDLITLGGRAVENIMLADTYDRNDQSERYLRFRDSFHGKFKTPPNHASVASYDAATILFAALQAVGEGGNLKAAFLNSNSYKALQQEITFDAYGDSRRTLTAVVVKDGRFTRPK